MDDNELLRRHKRLLGCLSGLPKKMISVDSLDNIPEFVLHGLCNKECFNLERAAYFVDNPDFDCFKGVAGFLKSENDRDYDTIWQDPESFASIMQESEFNQQVRAFLSKSVSASEKNFEQIVTEIGVELGFENPRSCCWDLRCFNKGILIYEKSDDKEFDQHFINSLYLLAFCPIF